MLNLLKDYLTYT